MYEEVSGCRCMSVCVDVCLSVRLREAMLMLKLCAYKKQLFHPPLYLSRAQKILPQTVMVPHPYLRLPWRFLHPQVGKTHSPFMCPRMCPSRVGLVCHHVFCFSFLLFAECVSFLQPCLSCINFTAHYAKRYDNHPLCTRSHACASSVPAFALIACMRSDLHHWMSIWGGQGFTVSVSCTQISPLT